MNTRFRLPWLARLRLRWLAVLLPLGISVAGMILLRSGQLANPILYMRADAGTLLGLLGLIASAGLACTVAVRDRLQQTRQRSAEQALALAADDRRRFLRRLDHELKNPLTAIRAGLANVAEEPANSVRRDALNSVEAQTMRLSRLAADLRKLAELETRPLERAPVNLAELLQEAMAVAEERPEAGSRHLRLTLPQAPWPLPAVPGDRDLLFLAVHNLLDNAIKFTASGDTIELRAFEDGAGVVIEVADTGRGIPDDELAHIWEELYRGQAAREVTGSGLGLALVRAILTRHGGTASARSRMGQGTVITLRLPAQ